jgi:GNAT superfamily N-acetyltransferase
MRELFSGSSHSGTQLLSDYYALFEQAFPAEDERPAKARLEQRLQDPSSPLDIVCALKGNEILGGRQFKIFENPNQHAFAAGEFLFVVPEYRRLKLGNLIIQQSEQRMIARGAAFAIGEFHDPSLCSDRDRALDELAGVTPEGRLQFWARQRYQQFNAPYVCAPVFGSTEWITNCTLGFRQLTQGDEITSISTSFYLNTVTRYWDSFSSGYKGSHEYETFMRYFDGVKELSVIPLTATRTFYQRRADNS